MENKGELSKALEDFGKVKRSYDEYGKVRLIFEQYLEMRRKLGKPRRLLTTKEDIERDLESMGIRKTKGL